VAEHTAGPWTTEAIFGDEGLDIVLDYEVPRAGSPILLGSVFAEDGDPIGPAEARANARLMASAPDLLAACLAMLGTWGSDDEDAIIEARDMARAAVTRAKGGQG
jgi:hypothetical protein